MSTDVPPYPVLIDTDALVALANSPLWEEITDNIGLTTTNVCRHELERHREETNEYAPEGSRPHRLHHGSVAALEALEDPAVPFETVASVPRPHGADAGEASLRQHLGQHPDAVDLVVMMDAHGRRSIRRTVEEAGIDARVVPPTFLFYVLYDAELVDEGEFCTACADLLRNEGWTGYQAVQAAWEGIPIDCSEHVDEELLP